MNTTFTKTISIEDVYGTAPEIPEGYKVLDFRLPRKGEYYAAYNGYWLLAYEDHIMAAALPALILSKLPDPVVVKMNVENTIKTTVGDIYDDDVTIPTGYEFVDFRIPKPGELFLSATSGSVLIHDGRHNFSYTVISDSRIIVKKCS
jgi:hypothetical protein